MFRFQTQMARDASGAGIRGGLRRSPLRVKSAVLTFGRSLPIYPKLRTYAAQRQLTLCATTGVERLAA